MALEIRVVELQPGQQSPEGCHGVGYNGGILWEGEAGTFPDGYTGEVLSVDAYKTFTKLTPLYANVKQFISEQPNGWPRYDGDLKLNLINAAMASIAAGQEEPEAVTLAKNWIMSVQGAFFALKTAIANATTIEEVQAIDVSIDTLESKYGREGTVAADPAVSTDDLFA